MSMAKLTLSMEKDVIRTAKRLARQRKTSVSAMVTRYVRSMAAPEGRKRIPIGPVTRRATGLARLPKGKSDRQVLVEALMEKHGLNK